MCVLEREEVGGRRTAINVSEGGVGNPSGLYPQGRGGASAFLKRKRIALKRRKGGTGVKVKE